MKAVKGCTLTLAEYDCVVIATNHDAFDYKLIKRQAKLIVDTRGVTWTRRQTW